MWRMQSQHLEQLADCALVPFSPLPRVILLTVAHPGLFTLNPSGIFFLTPEVSNVNSPVRSAGFMNADYTRPAKKVVQPTLVIPDEIEMTTFEIAG